MESSFLCSTRELRYTLLSCVQDSSSMGSLLAIEQLFVEKMVRLALFVVGASPLLVVCDGVFGIISAGLMSALPSCLYCRKMQARPCPHV